MSAATKIRLTFKVPPPLPRRPYQPGNLLDLNDDQCRFTLDINGSTMCGARVADGKRYCPHHFEIAHAGLPPRIRNPPALFKLKNSFEES